MFSVFSARRSSDCKVMYDLGCDCTLCLLKETLRKCRRLKFQRKHLILNLMVLETEQELSDVPVDLYVSNAFVAKTLEKSGF